MGHAPSEKNRKKKQKKEGFAIILPCESPSKDPWPRESCPAGNYFNLFISLTLNITTTQTYKRGWLGLGLFGVVSGPHRFFAVSFTPAGKSEPESTLGFEPRFGLWNLDWIREATSLGVLSGPLF